MMFPKNGGQFSLPFDQLHKPFSYRRGFYMSLPFRHVDYKKDVCSKV